MQINYIKNLPQEQRNSKYINIYLLSFENPALILHRQVTTINILKKITDVNFIERKLQKFKFTDYVDFLSKI